MAESKTKNNKTKDLEDSISENNKELSNDKEVVKRRTAQEIIASLKSKQQFEEVVLPSRNFLYHEFNLSVDEPIHVKPMTIEEEKILSTPRLLKSGQAIDKIFSSCVYEKIPPHALLSPDRVFLLFYLRGISYGPGYEVEIRCPSCGSSFNEEISLDTLPVETLDDDFDGEFKCILPDSELEIKYRPSTGQDERNLIKHRETMVRGFGKHTTDDTVIRRNIMLVTSIEDLTNKMEIESIIKNLSLKDSSYLRDSINNVGFGIDTQVDVACPFCYHEWSVDLPIDANFFFPRMNKTR